MEVFVIASRDLTCSFPLCFTHSPSNLCSCLSRCCSRTRVVYSRCNVIR